MSKMFSLLFITLFSFNLMASCEEENVVLKKNDMDIELSSFKTSEKSERLIVILPPTGGVNFIDRNYAQHFCKKGMSTVIIKSWSENFEVRYDLSVHTDYYMNAQAAIDSVLNQHSDYKIGMLGTSLGSLHASISFARNDFIDSVFLIVGGGNLASMIARTDQEQTLKFKEIRFELYGFESEDEYEEALKPHIPFEVLDMEIKREGRKIGMSISYDDVTVPTSNQIALKKKWNPDLLLDSNFNHTNTVLKTWLLNKRAITRFFKD